jgi:hypothetical protein
VPFAPPTKLPLGKAVANTQTSLSNKIQAAGMFENELALVAMENSECSFLLRRCGVLAPLGGAAEAFDSLVGSAQVFVAMPLTRKCSFGVNMGRICNLVAASCAVWKSLVSHAKSLVPHARQQLFQVKFPTCKQPLVCCQMAHQWRCVPSAGAGGAAVAENGRCKVGQSDTKVYV